MSRPNEGSLRMGPISIFTLVVVLSLAVMAVLSVATASADLARAERQGSFTRDDYANEVVGQELLAALDGIYRATGALTQSDLDRAVTQLGADGDDPAESAITATATRSGARIHIEAASKRCLDIVLDCGADGLSIRSWEASTAWTEDTTDTLWTGV